MAVSPGARKIVNLEQDLAASLDRERKLIDRGCEYLKTISSLEREVCNLSVLLDKAAKSLARSERNEAHAVSCSGQFCDSNVALKAKLKAKDLELSRLRKQVDKLRKPATQSQQPRKPEPICESLVSSLATIYL